MHGKIIFTRDELDMLLTVAARDGCTPGDALRRMLAHEFYKCAPPDKSPEPKMEKMEVQRGERALGNGEARPQEAT